MEQQPQKSVSRRAFVKSSLAGASVLAGWHAGAPSFGEKIAPSDQLNAAVIGAGGIACFHAEHQLTPYFRVRGVADVDRVRAVTFNQRFCHGNAHVTGDYRELLERDDVDVVFVCTPDHWHTKICVDALRSGKDVYCEKPLTLTVDEGRLIQTTHSQTDRILQVGTQQRSDPNFQTAVALAQSGRVGAIKQITVAIGGGAVGGPFVPEAIPAALDWNQWLGQAPKADYIPQRCHGNFRWWYEYSGGKMTDWGAHHVDIAYWALPEISEGTIYIDPVEYQFPVPLVEGMPTIADQYNTASSFRIECKMPGGTKIVVRDNAPDLGFENGLLFECEDGRYFVNRGKLSGKPIEDLAADPLPDETLVALRKRSHPMNHVASFYWCCRDRTMPISDAASHMDALALCHLANSAMRLGRPLEWDPRSKQIIKDEQASKWLARPQREGFEVS